MIASLLFYISIPIGLFAVDLFFNKFIKNQGTRKIISIIFYCCFFVLLAGLRSTHVGNDTGGYFEFYNECLETTDIAALSKKHPNFETGFIYYTFFFSKTKLPFVFYNLFSSIIIFVPVVIYCFQESKYPVLSIVLFCCFGLFTFNMSGIRQAMATGICLLSLIVSNYFKNKFLRMVPMVFVFAASTIHTTAVFFILIYFLQFFKLDKKEYIFVFAAGLLIYVLILPSVIAFGYFSITDLYSAYSYDGPSSITSFSGSTALFVILLFLIIVKMTTNSLVFKDPFLRFVSNAKYLSKLETTTNETVELSYGPAFAMFLFQTIFFLADPYTTLAARLALYGGMGFCIVLPNFVSSVFAEKKINILYQICIVILSCAYFYFTTLRYNYLGLMPYGVL